MFKAGQKVYSLDAINDKIISEKVHCDFFLAQCRDYAIVCNGDDFNARLEEMCNQWKETGSVDGLKIVNLKYVFATKKYAELRLGEIEYERKPKYYVGKPVYGIKVNGYNFDSAEIVKGYCLCGESNDFLLIANCEDIGGSYDIDSMLAKMYFESLDNGRAKVDMIKKDYVFESEEEAEETLEKSRNTEFSGRFVPGQKIEILADRDGSVEEYQYMAECGDYIVACCFDPDYERDFDLMLSQINKGKFFFAKDSYCTDFLKLIKKDLILSLKNEKC